MELHGIATALYDREKKSVVSVTTISSESTDRIFIERTQKAEVEPSNASEVRDAFRLVLDEICKQPPHIYDCSGQAVQVPTAVVYGTPERHPTIVYRSMMLAAFRDYFPRGASSNENVIEMLENLFMKHHAKYGQPGSVIEYKAFHLYLPAEEESKPSVFTEEDVSREFDRLHRAADTGDEKALGTLRGYARDAARRYVSELKARGIAVPRFVQYGPRNGKFHGTNRYTALEWYNLRDIFVDELARYMPIPHNVCVKTPNDEPAPPFADICATQLADYWDILEGRRQKRHVFVRRSRDF